MKKSEIFTIYDTLFILQYKSLTMDKIYTDIKNIITNKEKYSIYELYENIDKIELSDYDKCLQLFNYYVYDNNKNDEILEYIYDIMCRLGKGDPNLRNNNNTTIFMMASKFGIDKIIITMINNDNIDVNFKDNDKMTALLYAIQNCMESTVELLLSYNAKLYCEENGVSPELFSACHAANLKITRMILDSGVNLNAENENGENALNCALCNYKNAEEIAKYLIKSGVNINNTKYNPLLQASVFGFIEIVEILIENNTDINYVDKKGNTALMYASKFGHCNIVELLVNKGADVNIKNKENTTALIYGAWRSHGTQCEKIVKILLHAKADVDIIDSSGNTALSYILGNPNKKIIVSLLLENNANIEKASAGIFHLIQQEFCIDYKKALEHMKYLISEGLNINISDENGNTPLMYASGYNKYGGYTQTITEDLKLEIVKFLIGIGADVYAKNNSGDTASFFALQENNYKIRDYITNIIIEKLNKSTIIEI